MLLHERYLGLYRELYVLQVCAGATIRGDSRQDPRASLLIHQAAVPSIGSTRTRRRRPRQSPTGNTSGPPLIPSAMSTSGAGRQLFFKQLNSRSHCAVYGVDVSPAIHRRRLRQVVQLRLLTLGNNGVAHSLVNPTNRVEQVFTSPPFISLRRNGYSARSMRAQSAAFSSGAVSEGSCSPRFPVPQDTSADLGDAAADETRCESGSSNSRRCQWGLDVMASHTEKASATDCRTLRAPVLTTRQSHGVPPARAWQDLRVLSWARRRLRRRIAQSRE